MVTPAYSRAASPRYLAAITAGSLIATMVAGLHVVRAGEYLLGPQDKVRLKIYEWRASRDVIFEWTALNDQFTVGADGSLSLPFVGEIQAAGTDSGDLGRAIGERLMRHMGLGRQPDVAVEVVQFRPFYIVGHVTAPGEFPFRPGLSVLQAVSIAGGLRTREESIGRLEREVIAGRGEIGLLDLSGIALLARKARLEAELADASQIRFPDQLTARTDDASTALLMEQERLIFQARRDGLSTQLRALQELKAFLEKELEALEAQLVFYDRQIELVQKELTGVSSLVNKGFATAPREISLERALTQVQSDRLSAQTSLLRARQEISRTDISSLELRNRYTNDVTVALRETQAQLDETGRKADTAMQLLHESEIAAPRLLAFRTGAARAEPTYTILRLIEGQTTEVKAGESTPVEPGDTVKVEIPLPWIDDGGLAPERPLTVAPSISGNLAAVPSIGMSTPR
jgi:polysaccharide export outer membrane protein/exopolysaccharide production protein ExoF